MGCSSVVRSLSSYLHGAVRRGQPAASILDVDFRQIPISCLHVSGSLQRRNSGRKGKPPSVVRGSKNQKALEKSKPLVIPDWFTYQALAVAESSGSQKMTADQRSWLASCLNTVFDNCLVLAPKDGIAIGTLMSHRKPFARWLYQRLTPGSRDFLMKAHRSGNSFLVSAMWPVVRDYMHNQHFEALNESQRLLQLANMTKPHTWYPLAAGIQQRIVYHAGPTNSGKTYNALQALKTASSGMYCGPLRLLALEIFERLNKEGLPCNLVTGQERTDVPHAKHISCTVEMSSTAQVVDVAVIDEIQMLAHESRGWAWTRALLGVPAREVHVCGDHSCTDLVKTLCNLTGKGFHLETYERLTPLTVDEDGLNGDGYSGLQPGDCVIAFSRRELYRIKAEIERTTGHKAAIIYGALPPAARRVQAQLFNDSDTEYQVLVASDAIGMGITLNLRRIIFHSLRNYNPNQNGFQLLDPSHVKQIAGRAGRKGTQWEHGLVTTRDPRDITYLQHALSLNITGSEQSAAGLLPTFDQLEEYALSRGYPENATFAAVLQQFAMESQQENLYFLCSQDGMLAIARATDDIANLSLKDRAAICTAPVDERNKPVFNAFLIFIERFAEYGTVPLGMNPPVSPPNNIAELAYCESAYQVVSIWLWLSMRFTEAFPDRTAAEDLEQALQSLICEGLATIPKNHDQRENRAREEFTDMIDIFTAERPRKISSSSVRGG